MIHTVDQSGKCIHCGNNDYNQYLSTHDGIACESCIDECEICHKIVEDCNLSEMANFDRVCLKCYDGSKITLKNIINAWDRLGDICINEDDEIESSFTFAGMYYPAGTDREEIWHNFDEILFQKFNTCIGDLMDSAK